MPRPVCDATTPGGASVDVSGLATIDAAVEQVRLGRPVIESLLYAVALAVGLTPELLPAIVSVSLLVVLLGGGVALKQGAQMPWLFAPLALALLFCFAVALHAELFRTRPEPAQLTTFYLAMSVGGVVGGAFCAIVAPLAPGR